jgi:hypothetical protein
LSPSHRARRIWHFSQSLYLTGLSGGHMPAYSDKTTVYNALLRHRRTLSRRAKNYLMF